MRGTPIYKPDYVRVVRYFKGTQARVMTAKASFKWMLRKIEERHGEEAAATACDWGWQIPPID